MSSLSHPSAPVIGAVMLIDACHQLATFARRVLAIGTVVVACAAATVQPAAGGSAEAGGDAAPDVPLFLTFDSHVDPATVAQVPWLDQEVFVWGSSGWMEPELLAAWKAAAPHVKLSYYMPYSRAPGRAQCQCFTDITWWHEHHPDWIMYRCDRKTVAYWGTETAATHGSVPLDFTNPDVVDWQIQNQSSVATKFGYSAMAFDNFGGGARHGANPGQACGVWQRNGTWKELFKPVSKGDGSADIAEASVRWIELAKQRLAVHAPRLGIIPNLCIDRPSGRSSSAKLWNETCGTANGDCDWATSTMAARVLAASTAILSERGFTGWGGGPVGSEELVRQRSLLFTAFPWGSTAVSCADRGPLPAECRACVDGASGGRGQGLLLNQRGQASRVVRCVDFVGAWGFPARQAAGICPMARNRRRETRLRKLECPGSRRHVGADRITAGATRHDGRRADAEEFQQRAHLSESDRRLPGSAR